MVGDRSLQDSFLLFRLGLGLGLGLEPRSEMTTGQPSRVQPIDGNLRELA
jgi:hypothetical protein